MGNSPSNTKSVMGFTPGSSESKNSKYQKCRDHLQCKKGLTRCEKNYPVHKRGKYKNSRNFWEARNLWGCREHYVRKYFPRKNKSTRIINKKRHRSARAHRFFIRNKCHNLCLKTRKNRKGKDRLTRDKKCKKKCKKTYKNI
jgi:hypothetical protein